MRTVVEKGEVSIHDLASDPRWLTTERIEKSQFFQRSHRLREFLSYIVERQLHGHPEDITEFNIGTRVYERGESYNPVEDNIVRVSARQLRTKLREFYDSEGKDEPWVIEIPKGGYVPVFHERKPPELTGEGEKPEPTRRSKFRLFLDLGVVVAVLVLIGALLTWFRPHATAVLSAQKTDPNLVTLLFGASAEPVQIVMSDSALVLMESMLGRRPTLAEYVDQQYREMPQVLINNRPAAETWRILATRQITNLGDVDAAARIAVTFSATEPGFSATIRSARNMNARDFRSGNFIIFGDSYSNPWTQLFQEDQFTFRFQSDSIHDPPIIVDRNPELHKPVTYSEATDNGHGYARIAMVPNLAGTGRVLLIAGISMESTESAADFCLDSESVSLLARALGVKSPLELPPFEALLRTSKAEGTGMQAQLLSARVLSGTR